MLLLYISIAVAVIAIASIFVALFRYHRCKSADNKHTLKADLMWTLIPIIILIFMAYPAIRLLIH